MNRRLLKKLVVCLALAVIFGTPVWAFLGFGDIVFDPSNYAEALEQVTQLSMQYAQLVDTYLMIRNQYDQMVRMAQRVPVDMVDRYRLSGHLKTGHTWTGQIRPTESTQNNLH